MAERPRPDAATWGRTSLLALAAALPLSIAAAQAALAVATLAWLAAGRPGPRSSLISPALAYCLLTLVAAIASADPGAGIADAKELLLFSLLLVVPAHAALGRHLTRCLFLGAAASTLWGLGAYLLSPGGLLHRTRGAASHYMSFAGVLMLTAVVAAARLLRTGSRKERAALALFLVLMVAGLEASYARNAWLGLIAGVVVSVAATRPRVLPVAALLGALAIVAAPADVRSRAGSILHVEANLDRLEMVRVGLGIIRDHPLFGVGPNQLPQAYAERSTSKQPHLHNNALQIAAERGLPALGAWIWLMARAGIESWRRLRRQPGAAPAFGLGALAALLVAGLFEYNFGDSEVKMTFLLVIALAVHEPAHGEAK